MAKEKVEFDFEADSGFMELAEDLDEYDWEWIDMGDGNVCPDCIKWASLPPAKFSEWIQNRAEPGRGESFCGDSCRCLLAPADLIKSNPDLKEGGKITIKDPGEYDPDPKTDYKIFEELDAEILEYKVKSGGMKLPDEFYQIKDAQGRIDFLKGFSPGGIPNPPPPAPKPAPPPEPVAKEITQDQIEAEAKVKLKAALAKLEKLKSTSELEAWAKENTSIETFRSFKAKAFNGLPIKNVKAALARVAELDSDWVIRNNRGGKIHFGDAEKRRGVYASASEHGINIAKSTLRNMKEVEESFAYCIKTGFHPQGEGSALKMIIDHEFAHTLTQYNFKQRFSGGIYYEFDAIKTKYNEWLKEASSKIKNQVEALRQARLKAFQDFNTKTSKPEMTDPEFKKLHLEYQEFESNVMAKIKELEKGIHHHKNYISGYADSNVAEFTAEAFSKYLNNSDPGEFSKMVYDLMKREYGKN